MTPKILVLALIFTAICLCGATRADDAPQTAIPTWMTAVISVDGNPVSIMVDDYQACLRAVGNYVNGLRAAYQGNYTVTDVVGECVTHDGLVAAFGRCGVKPMSGSITALCNPQMQQVQ